MTETIVAQIIGMVAMLAAGVLGAVVADRLYRRRRSEDRAEERVVRHEDRLRDAWAVWHSSLLEQTDRDRRVILYKREQEDQEAEIAKSPEHVQAHFAASFREMSLAAMDATRKENVAYANVLLVDGNSERLSQAESIRFAMKRALADCGDKGTQSVARRFFQLDQEQAAGLSKLIARIREDLKQERTHITRSIGKNR